MGGWEGIPAGQAVGVWSWPTFLLPLLAKHQAGTSAGGVDRGQV